MNEKPHNIAVSAPPAEPTHKSALANWLHSAIKYAAHYGGTTVTVPVDLARAILDKLDAAPDAEPVAQPEQQQNTAATPTIYSWQSGADSRAGKVAVGSAATHEPVAQQPPPTQDDADSIRARLLWLSTIEEPSERERSICRQAAARIESDAERIRELEADVYNAAWNLGGCDSLASGWLKPDEPIDESMARPALLSVRKMAGELAASRERERALREALRLVLPMAKGYATEHPVGNNVAMVAEAASAIATPDSAASPTGGAK